MRKAVLIDTDCGVDDAIALMAALCGPIEVVAITCVAGNTTVENVVSNVSKVLKVCQREDVPFFAGSTNAVCRETDFPKDYFGKDGLGNCPAKYTTGPKPQPVHAAQALVDISKSRRAEITLVLIGPCTNLAVAQLIDPKVTSYFKEIICLGGNLEGRGNITPGAEFNFASDPEAASSVLLQTGCHVTLVPWESVLANTIPWDFYKQLTAGTTYKSQFLADICRYTERHYTPGQGYQLGDFLAVQAALDETSVVKKKQERLAVELRGDYTSGQVVVGWSDTVLPKILQSTTIADRFADQMVQQTLTQMTT